MSKKPAAKPEPKKPDRNVDDIIGQCMRTLAVNEGVLKGTWDALAEPAKEFWRKRSAALRELAAKQGVKIGEAE